MAKSKKKKLYFTILFIIVTLFCILLHKSSPHSVFMESDPVDTRELPIIMYHSVINSTSRAGQYIVTPATVEADFKYLTEHGYEAVSINQLISYSNGETSLPAKPVLITFDDAHYNNYTYILPLLLKYDLKAVISAVGSFTDSASNSSEPLHNNYSYLTWPLLKELLNTGVIDIANHSNNLHDPKTRLGAVKALGESDMQFAQIILSDFETLQEKMKEHLDYTPKVLAYPFGKYSALTEEVAKELGFEVTLTCAERVNVIKQGEPKTLYSLGRFNRPYGITTESFMQKMGI